MVHELRTVGAAEPGVLAQLAHAARATTLEDVLRWSAELVEVIVQDEYTHDVIVRDPGRLVYVVFDTT